MEVVHLPDSDSFMLLATREERECIEALIGGCTASQMIELVGSHKKMAHFAAYKTVQGPPNNIIKALLAIHQALWNHGEMLWGRRK